MLLTYLPDARGATAGVVNQIGVVRDVCVFEIKQNIPHCYIAKEKTGYRLLIIAWRSLRLTSNVLRCRKLQLML